MIGGFDVILLLLTDSLRSTLNNFITEIFSPITDSVSEIGRRIVTHFLTHDDPCGETWKGRPK